MDTTGARSGCGSIGRRDLFVWSRSRPYGLSLFHANPPLTCTECWYWIEHQTAAWATGAAENSTSANAHTEGTSALEIARAWVPGLTEYHQLEMLVWCLLLPGFVFTALGGGLAAHRTASRIEGRIAAAVLVAVTALALSFSTDRLYMIMWDASIHWSNWLGWTYYDFTVRFFVIAPMIAIATGGPSSGAGTSNGDARSFVLTGPSS